MNDDENMNFVCCVRDSRREEPIDEEEQSYYRCLILNIVEREGISFRNPCKPLLVAIYQPEEGAIQDFEDPVAAVGIAKQLQEHCNEVFRMVKETNSNEHCNVKLVSILVLKCYSMTMWISLKMTLRMVIMILKRRKTEIALVAWEMLAMKMAT
uniref:Uncharacterized protein At2g19250 n=2 Tax=Arabidopsis thaliana TaxID=3702 RepID=O64558_ARATH|nr:hypothetical protein [Arabidopsis thaliana]